jgi:hypothetical protein
MDTRLSVTSPLSSGRWDVRPGPDSWDCGLRTSPRAHIGPAPPRAHENKVLGDGLHSPGPLRGSGAATCGSQAPMGQSLQLASGPGPPFPPGWGPAPPRAPKVATPGPALPRARGRRSSAGRQPNNRITCGLVGWVCPSQSMVCPTDTTVSPPVTKAARHCALRTGRRRVVTSRRRARE